MIRRLLPPLSSRATRLLRTPAAPLFAAAAARQLLRSARRPGSLLLSKATPALARLCTSASDLVTTSSGLMYRDVLPVPEGGRRPNGGDTVRVHYTGRLDDGTVFDSSHQRGQPISFELGAGRVIKGWDEGIASMVVGGKRQLVIPSHLGYGARGAPPAIPPSAWRPPARHAHAPVHAAPGSPTRQMRTRARRCAAAL